MLIEVSVGEAIFLERRRRNLTIKDLAVIAGVSMATISSCENGNANVSTDKLVKICNALDIRIDSVFIKSKSEEEVSEDVRG